MIKKFKNEYLDEIIDIWIKTNIESHNFIPKKYWYENKTKVKKLLLQSEIYVYIEDDLIKGFIGLNENKIEGLFVKDKFQSLKIGTKLLNKIKKNHSEIYLKVYVKNKSAINFYEKNNFKIIKEELDENTYENEYLMLWQS